MMADVESIFIMFLSRRMRNKVECDGANPGFSMLGLWRRGSEESFIAVVECGAV